MKTVREFPPADPINKPVFFECGQCGHFHSTLLPGNIDCRDDRHRFTAQELDDHYTPLGWDEISQEEQNSHDED